MSSLLLHSADFLVQGADAFLRGGALYIENGIVQDIGPSDKLNRRHTAEESIDLSGCIVAPGLINAHNHLYEIASRGLGKDWGTEGCLAKSIYPVDRFMQGDDYYHAALVALGDSLRQGTTAVIEQLANYARFHADREFEAYLQTGIRGAVARASTNRPTIDPGENRSEEEDLKASEAFLKK
ncbi:MAG: amidohydrolase family protein [Nitrospinota bacterium]|nr:amidohydrolase family protein [Nitrospinota bacterium]